jgi:hypothetical protein
LAAFTDLKQQRPQAMLIKTDFRVMVMPVVQPSAKVFQELRANLLSIVQKNLQIADAMEAVEGEEQNSRRPPRSRQANRIIFTEFPAIDWLVL